MSVEKTRQRRARTPPQPHDATRQPNNAARPVGAAVSLILLKNRSSGSHVASLGNARGCPPQLNSPLSSQ